MESKVACFAGVVRTLTSYLPEIAAGGVFIIPGELGDILPVIGSEK